MNNRGIQTSQYKNAYLSNYNQPVKENQDRKSLMEIMHNSSRDTFELSAEGEIATAVFDKNFLVNSSDLTFYFGHANNPSAILDAINFGGGPVSYETLSSNPDPEKYGLVTFESDNGRQAMPAYAVPKINHSFLDNIKAENNELILKNRSYYSFQANNDQSYSWRVGDGIIGWAATEHIADTVAGIPLDNNANRYMLLVGNTLSELAKGNSFSSSKDKMTALTSVGIKPGHFKIDAGAGTHNYILKENGSVYNVDDKIDSLNKCNWIKDGYKEGEVFEIYGNEYTINSEGFISISKDDIRTSTDIVYPYRTKQERLEFLNSL